MGPFIPSIILTRPNTLKRTLHLSSKYCEIWDNVGGRIGIAMTSRGPSRGSLVDVWKPNTDTPMHLRYFCHGYSLDTYRRYGY